MDRARKNRMLRVPELKYQYVFRDSWTRLNVRPAKVMQVSRYNVFQIYLDSTVLSTIVKLII